MTQPVFDRLLLPIANKEDAEATYRAVKPYVKATTDIIVLHITKTDETDSDTGPSEVAEKQAANIFDVFVGSFTSERVTIETEHRTGSDPIAEIGTAADELNITAVGVLPRTKNILLRILSRENTTTLISSTDVPVVILPRADSGAKTQFHLSGDDADPWVPKLLVPLEDSDKSFDALKFACTAYLNPDVLALHVSEPPSADVYSTMTPGTSEEFEEADRQHQQEINTLFQKANQLANQHGVELTTITQTGKVENTILECAERRTVDMIIVGSKLGKQPDQRYLGNTARSLIWNAPIPVMVV